MIQTRIPRPVAIGLTLALLVALLAFFARAASAQDVGADSTVRLTLGDAVRIAARQNAQVGSARSRLALLSAPRRTPRSKSSSTRSSTRTRTPG